MEGVAEKLRGLIGAADLEDDFGQLVVGIMTGTMNEEQLSERLGEAYEKLVGPYRPVAAAILDLIPDKLSGEIKLVAIRILELIKKLRGDQDLQKLQDELVALTAESRFRKLKTYMGVGFERAEAMQLLLADISSSSASTWVKQGQSLASKGSASARKSNRGKGFDSLD